MLLYIKKCVSFLFLTIPTGSKLVLLLLTILILSCNDKSGVSNSNNGDIESLCGNGKVDTGELCDTAIPKGEEGACPSFCAVEDICRTALLSGRDCVAHCLVSEITNSINNDGCCPQGSNNNNDNDCTVICGNGVIESGETCDPPDSCPSTCDDNNSCTLDRMVGSAEGGNYIWHDANADGIQDEFEDGIEDVRMKLKWAGKDDKWGNSDDEITRTDTNHNGHYTFDNLCEGKYKVYVKNEDVKMLTQTYDPDSKNDNKTKVTLKGNKDDHTKADFGYQGKPTAPITGSGEATTILTLIILIAGFITYRRFKNSSLTLKK